MDEIAQSIFPKKFSDPHITATGEPRASVSFRGLEMLWLNTGTLCNLTCAHCYIESSPRNDRLAYLTRGDVQACLAEIKSRNLPTHEIGVTGGEPFMNPDIMAILSDCLAQGFRLLVLTNAMKPMWQHRDELLALKRQYHEKGGGNGAKLVFRVSLDHYTVEGHEQERGPGSWVVALQGVDWLLSHGFAVHIAGRTFTEESEEVIRAGFAGLFAAQSWDLQAHDPHDLLLFPEMDETRPVAEITTSCWKILGVSPSEMMCATSRMVVRRRGAKNISVVACTLMPYAPAFDLGTDLRSAEMEVALNHPHCARFCVLGGGTCSG